MRKVLLVLAALIRSVPTRCIVYEKLQHELPSSQQKSPAMWGFLFINRMLEVVLQA